jgi:alpha-1,2-mannosyltransferase
MVRQAWASVCVAAQGLRILVPSVWIDTTGWAFPYLLVRMTGASVAAYVHYPTISTDMLSRVRDRAATFNNNSDVASSAAKSGLKLLYYQLMALLYGAVGGCANVAMVNSSWTRRHVAQLWWRRSRPNLVYPPADTAALQALPLDRRLKRVYIVSVAQFRPEKDHKLQLRAFAAARARAERLTDSSVADAILSARLQLVGGCRGPEDEARLEELKKLAKELKLSEEIVEFRVNVPFEELHELLGDAVAGLHSMVDEHFGISVVEYMAAGAVPIAHNSGGPREDIVLPELPGRDGCGPGQRTGFLCRTVEQYTDALMEVIGMGQVARLEVAAAARRRAAAFSDERFKNEFIEAVAPLLPPRSTPS